jgi:hypothetical protein
MATMFIRIPYQITTLWTAFRQKSLQRSHSPDQLTFAPGTAASLLTQTAAHEYDVQCPRTAMCLAA